jgi:uncharacterized protein YxjI
MAVETLTVAAVASALVDDRFSADAYVIEQLIRPLVNLYRVSAVIPGVSEGTPVAFVRQKRMAIKEDIRFFADENETNELFRIKARRAIDIGGRYDVTEPDGQRFGVLERKFAKSLIRSTWAILDGEESELAVAQEKSFVIAIVRRLQDFLPLPYHFTISRGEQEVGGVTRHFSLRDRYTLDLAGDEERLIDRRLGVALAVALDTIQDR